MTEKKLPKIMDCTLRDGSYVINFQFSAVDTESLVSELDLLGIDYIEVGHGIGMGASLFFKPAAFSSDIEYMKAAAKASKKSKWGMFCIPGIATLDNVREAADQGIDFIRIGTNFNDIKKSEAFISLSKKLNIEVCTNFMKSYVLPPEEFAEIALSSSKLGSDIIYIVDSSGGMTPKEVSTYIRTTKDKAPNIKIGFHGHNNLGLGVANALVCAEEEIEIIDVSLQGFGRGGGNVPTEQLLCALLRSGYSFNIDPLKIMDLGELYIRPRIERRGLCSLDTVSGLAQFHSSYMPIILEASKKFNVDPKKIILKLCEEDKTNATKINVENIAKNLNKLDLKINALYEERYYGEEQNPN